MAEAENANLSGGADRPVDIGEAAAFWLARQDRGFAAGEAEEFARWREADPRHEAEFAQLETDWRRMDLAKCVPELAALARQAEAETRGARRRKPMFPLWMWGAVLTASAAALALTWTARWRTPPASMTTTYAVVPDQMHALTLADGSVVELRGDSEVRAEFTLAERRVRLVHGEAHFKVTKNPARPFIVAAGSLAVRAVGTAFDVRLAPAAVDVLVTEGRVRIDRDAASDAAAKTAAAEPVAPTTEVPVLTAGERVRLPLVKAEIASSAPVVAALAPMEIDQELAWQKTWLVFTRTPLAEAIGAFNRQTGGTGGPRLVIEDETLRERRIGGTFRADNVDGFVRLLEQGFDVRAERRDDGDIVLRAKR